jgi:hypothetical protein
MLSPTATRQALLRERRAKAGYVRRTMWLGPEAQAALDRGTVLCDTAEAALETALVHTYPIPEEDT